MSENKYKRFSKVEETRTALKKFKSCHVKARYGSEEEAAAKGSTVYLCSLCGKYHRSTIFKKGTKRAKKTCVNQKH